MSVMSAQGECSNRTGIQHSPHREAPDREEGDTVLRRLPSRAILGGKWENGVGGRVTGPDL